MFVCKGDVLGFLDRGEWDGISQQCHSSNVIVHIAFLSNAYLSCVCPWYAFSSPLSMKSLFSSVFCFRIPEDCLEDDATQRKPSNPPLTLPPSFVLWLPAFSPSLPPLLYPLVYFLLFSEKFCAVYLCWRDLMKMLSPSSH